MASVDIRVRFVNHYPNSDHTWTLNIALDIMSSHHYNIYKLQGGIETSLAIVGISLESSELFNSNDYNQNAGLEVNYWSPVLYFQYELKNDNGVYAIPEPLDSWIQITNLTLIISESYNVGNKLWANYTQYQYLVEAYFPSLEAPVNVTGIKIPVPEELVTLYYPVKINNDENLVRNFTLYQNFPNPFNPETSLRYEIRVPSKVVLKIYNQSGEEIKTIENRYLPPGMYTINWDGTDMGGKSTASGVYYLKIKAGTSEDTKKMIKLK